MARKWAFIVSSLLTAVLLIFFFVYVYRIGSFNGFTAARSKISKAAALAAGIEEALENLSADENTAIITIPSISPENMVIPDKFDHCVMIRSNNILMFSMIPAEGTARKHRTLYYKNFPPCAFNTSGNMLEFTCTIRGKTFQHFSSVIPGMLPVPDKGEDMFR